MELPIVFESEGQQVVGMLHEPEGATRPWPTVLFFHGFTGNSQEPHRVFVRLARRLAASGMASLRIDFRGHGNSAGESVDMTLQGEIADARAALAFVRERDDLDSTRTGLVGMSLGGLVSAYVLGENPELLCGVLLCPVADAERVISRRQATLHMQDLEMRGYLDVDGTAVGKAFVDQLAASDPLKAIGKSRASLLILHGDADESVPLEAAYDYQRVLASTGGHVEVEVLKGSGHTFDGLPWVERILERGTEWLVRHLT